MAQQKIREKLLYTTYSAENKDGLSLEFKGGLGGFKACEIGESWARGGSVFYEIWEEGFFFFQIFLVAFFSFMAPGGIMCFRMGLFLLLFNFSLFFNYFDMKG